MHISDTKPLTAPMPASALRPSRLFVVEDSDIVRALWRTVVAKIPELSLSGEFNCASTAIDAIRREPPDVVLLDIHLSESDGMEVLRVVAAEYPMTKVIVVSNCADPTHRRCFTKAGAYAFSNKGDGLAAMRCMRCMLERLTWQINSKPILMRPIPKWNQTANGING